MKKPDILIAVEKTTVGYYATVHFCKTGKREIVSETRSCDTLLEQLEAVILQKGPLANNTTIEVHGELRVDGDWSKMIDFAINLATASASGGQIDTV